jgi:hypothetical protein
MPARYANFYADLAAPTHRENAATFAHTAPGAQLPGWLLSAFANLTEYHVLAYLGDDDEVHFIHRLCRHRASMRYPTTRFDGAYVGIIDEINAFGGALGAIDWSFFDEVGVDDTPGAAAITAALVGETDGQLATVPTDAAAARVVTRVGTLVPPFLVPELLRTLEHGSLTPRALWDVAVDLATHPNLYAACEPFVTWCRVAVAMGVGAANPLRSVADSGP